MYVFDILFEIYCILSNFISNKYNKMKNIHVRNII